MTNAVSTLRIRTVAAVDGTLHPDTLETGRTVDSTAGVLRTVRRCSVRLLNVVLVLVMCGGIVVVLGSAAGWWRPEVVLTGSMRPGIHPGDLEILVPIPTASIRVGEIVAFHPPGDGGVVVTHRVVSVVQDRGVWVTTRGDANNANDPWGKVRLRDSDVWRVAWVVPRVGFVSSWLRTPRLRLVVSLGAIVTGILVAFARIWRT